MTRLRQMMLDELERRNYTQNTKRAYLHAVADFARHFHRSPEQLRLDPIRDHQVHLFRTRRLKANSVTVHLAALRSVFVAVLKRHWPVDDTPYPKKPDTLPVVLSQQEVTRLIEAALTPLHKLLSQGARRTLRRLRRRPRLITAFWKQASLFA